MFESNNMKLNFPIGYVILLPLGRDECRSRQPGRTFSGSSARRVWSGGALVVLPSIECSPQRLLTHPYAIQPSAVRLLNLLIFFHHRTRLSV